MESRSKYEDNFGTCYFVNGKAVNIVYSFPIKVVLHVSKLYYTRTKVIQM